MHKALRQTGDSPESGQAYRAISAMPNDDWDRSVDSGARAAFEWLATPGLHKKEQS